MIHTQQPDHERELVTLRARYAERELTHATFEAELRAHAKRYSLNVDALVLREIYGAGHV